MRHTTTSQKSSVPTLFNYGYSVRLGITALFDRSQGAFQTTFQDSFRPPMVEPEDQKYQPHLASVGGPGHSVETMTNSARENHHFRLLIPRIAAQLHEDPVAMEHEPRRIEINDIDAKNLVAPTAGSRMVNSVNIQQRATLANPAPPQLEQGQDYHDYILPEDQRHIKALVQECTQSIPQPVTKRPEPFYGIQRRPRHIPAVPKKMTTFEPLDYDIVTHLPKTVKPSLPTGKMRSLKGANHNGSAPPTDARRKLTILLPASEQHKRKGIQHWMDDGSA